MVKFTSHFHYDESYASLYERWNDQGLEVLIPCYPHYLETLNQMYAYLPNINFYELPAGCQTSVVDAIAKEYGLQSVGLVFHD